MRCMMRVVLVLPCLVIGAWAQSLTLENAGADSGMGGVYTSPYGISVDGGSPLMLICDDFTTDISIGYTWQAGVTTLSQINSSDVAGLKFGTDLNAVQDYAAVAVLAAELTALPNIGTPAENTEAAGELSYAIWSIFDSALYTSLNSSGSTGFGTLTTTEVGAVDTYITDARSLVSAATVGGVVNLNNISVNGQSISSLTVYTPSLSTPSQEFITVSTPEASLPATLAVELSALVGVIFLMRRRLVRL